jgi:hypothetical protein
VTSMNASNDTDGEALGSARASCTNCATSPALPKLQRLPVRPTKWPGNHFVFGFFDTHFHRKQASCFLSFVTRWHTGIQQLWSMKVDPTQGFAF